MKFVLSLLVAVTSTAYAAFNPLHQQIRLSWPATITTVNEAATYLLVPTGYRVTLSPDERSETARILSRKIAPSAYEHRTMNVDDALLTIAGDDVVLYVDHEHKLISFAFTRRPL